MSSNSTNTEYNYLGGDSDLPAKEIQLSIQDDDQFVTACSANKNMMKICEGEGIWRDRLKGYYPKTVAYREVTGLTWRQYFPIVSLMTKYANSLITDNNIYMKRLVNYLAALNMNYLILFRLL